MLSGRFTFINEKQDGITKANLDKVRYSNQLNTSMNIYNSILPFWVIFVFITTCSLVVYHSIYFSEKSTLPQQSDKGIEEEVVQTNSKDIGDSLIIPDGSHANYQLFLKMFSEKQFLVEANIKVENRSETNWMDLQFYFIPNLINAAEIKEVKVDGEVMKYYLSEDSLRITLNKALQTGKEMEVSVSYTLTPPEDDLRLFRLDGSIALAEWYPMLCTYLNGWQKDPFYPGMESFFTGYSDFTVQYELLDGYTLSSSAEEDAPLHSRTGTLEARKIKEFYISLTKDTVIKTKKVNETVVRVIGSKQNEQSIDYVLDIAAESLKFFDQKIGKYPYKQLDVVYGYNYNIEYPGIVTVSDEGDLESQKHPIIHEVAHQWFFGLVSNDTYNDGWLDEGLTELSTDLFLLVHEKESLDESFAWVNWLYNERKPFPSNEPLEKYKENGGTAAYLYAQPVLKLWEVLGKEDPSGNKALAFLSDYFHTYTYQIVNTDEFIRFMKQHYDVDDPYFAEWLDFTPDYIYWKL
ncbi:M1 family metallopeptidase [Neobacillus sp. D3-1R]|uniref:M1 family metallopeptidase n=1 Tax=Neobacillus sp. D3-1R TaxID=3445778 RepID=UPI003F9F890C